MLRKNMQQVPQTKPENTENGQENSNPRPGNLREPWIFKKIFRMILFFLQFSLIHLEFFSL